MMMLKHALIRFAQLMIFLTVLGLVSCGGVPPFPAQYAYELDIENQACGKWKLVDPERVLYQHESDGPISDCQGVFGFSTKDTPNVLNWTRDRIRDGKTCVPKPEYAPTPTGPAEETAIVKNGL